GRGTPPLLAFYRLGADAFARGTGAARKPTPMKRALAGALLFHTQVKSRRRRLLRRRGRRRGGWRNGRCWGIFRGCFHRQPQAALVVGLEHLDLNHLPLLDVI